MMKRSFVLAALLMFGVFAPAVQAADTTIPAGVFVARQAGDQQLARDFLIGAKVHNADNKIIGDIEDLILDELNTVEGVIIGVGGVHDPDDIESDLDELVVRPLATKGSTSSTSPLFLSSESDSSPTARAGPKYPPGCRRAI